MEQAASPVRDHARGVGVGCEGQGDLTAVSMSGEHERETEFLCVMEEAWPMGQQQSWKILRNLRREPLENGNGKYRVSPV